MLYSTITSYAPLIIMVVSFAESMHPIITFNHERAAGHSRSESIAISFLENLKPISLTTFTTAIGFIGLNWAESPPFQDLGNIVAIGIVAAYLFTITLQPALMAIIPEPTLSNPGKEPFSRHAMGLLADFVIRHYKKFFFGNVLLVVIIGSFATRNVINDFWQGYFDERFEIRRSLDFAARNLSGSEGLEFSIPANGEGAINDPAYLAKLDEFKTWLKNQPGVLFVRSYSDLMKKLNWSMNGGGEEFNALPESREAAAQYLAAYELSLPPGLGLDGMISSGRDASLLSLMMHTTTASETRQLALNSEAWMKSSFPPFMQSKASGVDLVFGSVSLQNMKNMLWGSIGDLVFISLLTILAVRSVKYGLISMIPNLTPIILGFGIWGIFFGEIGLSVSIVGSIVLGIIIDDTIHFILKYNHARHDLGLSTEESIVYSFKSAGAAQIFISIVVASGFGMMAFSGFYPAKTMGLLTAIVILLAVFTDLFLLPPALLMIDRASKFGKAVAAQT
jgi:predicted RND superfamily exporter protein